MIYKSTCEPLVHSNISPEPSFLYRVGVAHLFSFPYCVYYYFSCLSGVTNGAGNTHPSGAPEFTTSF